MLLLFILPVQAGTKIGCSVAKAALPNQVRAALPGIIDTRRACSSVPLVEA